MSSPTSPRLFAALLALASASLAGCGARAEQDPAAGADVTRPVRLILPQPLPERWPVQGIGRLESISEQRLGFVSAGVLQRIEVDIGDRVTAGQVLARLDTQAIDAALRGAEEERLRAARDVERIEDLVARQLVARQQLDDARTGLEVAEAAVRSAGFPLRYATIRASHDGVVMQRLAEPGEIVAAGQAVLAVSSAGKGWRLPVALADRDALRLQPGDLAEVRVDALPGVALGARVREISGEASAASGAIVVDLWLDEGEAPLRSGLIARAFLGVPQPPGVFLPTSALLRAQGREASVMLAVEGLAVERAVQLGEVFDDRVQVVAGLDPGDAVIGEGAAWVDAGAPVRVLAD